MSSTEDNLQCYKDLDLWSSDRVLGAIWQGQMTAIEAVKPALSALEEAAEEAATRLSKGAGRIVYVGAGTSGLLAMQDGMELTPTFGWPLERILFLMAGGDAARLLPLGPCEDDEEQAFKDAQAAGFSKDDLIVAVAASGSTPYTCAIAREGKKVGAQILAIANNPGSQLADLADHAAILETGPEVLAGSTRMAAGTAQKAALTAFSTLLMTRLGYVVGGHMVNMIVDNDKLRLRAIRIVADLADVSLDLAGDAMTKAQGDIKLATLIARGCSLQQAQGLLADHEEKLRPAMLQVKG